jgi:hypothetical protein
LTPSGALDGGFSGNGFTRFAVPIHVARATTVTLTRTGDILVGGRGEGVRRFRDDETFVVRLLGGGPDSTAPRLKVLAARRDRSRSVLIRLGATEDCVVRLSGQVRRLDRSVRVKPRKLTLQRGRRQWVRLRVREKLPKRAVRLRMQSKISDSAGNSTVIRTTARVPG